MVSTKVAGMIRTTQEKLGTAYLNANKIIMDMNPITPTIMGALWREHFGLHHMSCRKYFWNDTEFWIEFPDDRDYTAFMLRFG